MNCLIIIIYFCSKVISNLVNLFNSGKEFAALIFKVIITFLNKFWKKRSISYFFKFGRIIAFSLLISQIISVTNDYLRYEIYIDMQLVLNLLQRLAFTFCLKIKINFPKNFKIYIRVNTLINRFVVWNVFRVVKLFVRIAQILIESGTAFIARLSHIFQSIIREK
jgi:hypothetical protein